MKITSRFIWALLVKKGLGYKHLVKLQHGPGVAALMIPIVGGSPVLGRVPRSGDRS